MRVVTKWFDREFEREVLDPRILRWLNTIGARGEQLSKQLISGMFSTGDPTKAHMTLKAVDTGRLMNSLAWEVIPKRLVVRIGTNVKYAIFVFLGTFQMGARPVLRTMLSMLGRELR